MPKPTVNLHFTPLSSIRPDGRTPLAVSGYYAKARGLAPDTIPADWRTVTTHHYDRDGCAVAYATPHGAVLITGGCAYLLA
jgi:hypothetical protein